MDGLRRRRTFGCVMASWMAVTVAKSEREALSDTTGPFILSAHGRSRDTRQGWTMSTFKRKSSPITVGLQAGTRTSPFSSSTVLTSSGIASLDDILGGGLPLSSSLLVIAPDTHSSYGELVQKYFISQGLASGQKVCVVDGEPGRFVSECMWHSNGISTPPVITGEDDKDDGNETDHEAKIEIAWRYEHLKPFSTSASGSKMYVY